LSILLLLPDGNVFPARFEVVLLAAGVVLFSLFVGVVVLPILPVSYIHLTLATYFRDDL
ncbi:hypothetical protein JQN42_24400, partial [Escherichia coli]|nr:hypothetical protein [Escherichia coli]